MVGLQEGNMAHGKPVPLIPKGSVLDQVAEENWGEPANPICVENRRGKL